VERACYRTSYRTLPCSEQLSPHKLGAHCESRNGVHSGAPLLKGIRQFSALSKTSPCIKIRLISDHEKPAHQCHLVRRNWTHSGGGGGAITRDVWIKECRLQHVQVTEGTRFQTYSSISAATNFLANQKKQTTQMCETEVSYVHSFQTLQANTKTQRL